jgi:hypothetical protein
MSLPDHIASRAHSLYINNMLAVVVNYAAELLPLHETAGVFSAPSVNSPQVKRKSQLASPHGACYCAWFCELEMFGLPEISLSWVHGVWTHLWCPQHQQGAQ